MSFILLPPKPPAVPELPESDELVISYSQISAWQKCMRAWKWNYLQEIVPIHTQDYLRLGTYVHKLLEIGYLHLQFGFSTKETVEIVRDYASTRIGATLTTEDLGVLVKALRLVMAYFEKMQKVFDEHARIKQVEYHFKLQLHTPQGRIFFLQGYVDLVLEIEGKIWIVDHKTTAGKFWSPLQLQMDGQLSTYSASMANVFGVAVNFLNTYDYKDFHAQPVTKLFKRVISYRTPKEKESILQNFGVIVDEILDRKERDAFPYSLTSNCPRCPYAELCLMEMKGFDDDSIRLLTEESFTKKQRRVDPIADALSEEGDSSI